jgi:hypothetical protein
VLSCKGEVKYGGSPFATALSTAYELALNDYPVTKLHGGIIYCDINIRPNAPGYWEAMRLGFAIAALIINNYTESEKLEEQEERVLIQPLNQIKYSTYINSGLVCGDHSSK